VRFRDFEDVFVKFRDEFVIFSTTNGNSVNKHPSLWSPRVRRRDDYHP
jgi:hypothetical protein